MVEVEDIFSKTKHRPVGLFLKRLYGGVFYIYFIDVTSFRLSNRFIVDPIC